MSPSKRARLAAIDPDEDDTVGRRLEKSLDDESFSDFTIRCKDRDFKVHRVILAGYDYFKGAFSNFKEADDRLLVLEEPADIIEPLLRFIYSGKYSSNEKDWDSFADDTIPLFHVDWTPLRAAQLYRAADYYDIEDLKKALEHHFYVTIKAHSTIGHPAAECPEHAKEFLEGCKYVYKGIPKAATKELRRIMRKAFWGAHRGMIESKEQREKFLEELPELAIDLAMAVDSGETPCQELRCGACCEPLDRHVFRGQAIA